MEYNASPHELNSGTFQDRNDLYFPNEEHLINQNNIGSLQIESKTKSIEKSFNQEKSEQEPKSKYEESELDSFEMEPMEEPE